MGWKNETVLSQTDVFRNNIEEILYPKRFPDFFITLFKKKEECQYKMYFNDINKIFRRMKNIS